ncbi:MAG: Thiol peroxidase, Bcp-type [Mycobacterium sp.]|nr:Thiol peroxidase, Bcp-type [Mycobacterium sp.]
MSKPSAHAAAQPPPAVNQPRRYAGARTRKRATRGIARMRGQVSGRRRGWIIVAAVIVVLAVIGLYLVYDHSQRMHDSTTGGRGFQHVAGQPGAGTSAPAFSLTSGAGKQVSLADYRGKNVLLYFQEGLTCQPCWDQIKDLEQNQPALRSAGIDAVVSITTDPANLIGQKVADEKLSTPVLSDPTMDVSRAYNANKYGMMGQMRDGHSFILVSPDGIIRWRADYGGPPDYTMFLPTQKMLADLTAERNP